MLVDTIAKDLSLPPAYVSKLARTAGHRYKTYAIKKRGGGTRTISHPARELKLLQRWLIKNVFVQFSVHRAATAYKKGASVARNAGLHRKFNYLRKVDFQDFFPSIRGVDVLNLLRNQHRKRGEEFTELDRELVRDLVCRGGSLTIGAPSSPIVSNLVMFEFDKQWSAYCRDRKIVYSRYADDLYFSTNSRDILGPLFADLRQDLQHRQSPRLRINEAKTVFTSRKRRKLVTGLVITPTGEVSLGRARKRFIKSLTFRNSRAQLSPEMAQSLYGTLAYARSVEPSFVDALRRKYGAAAIGNI